MRCFRVIGILAIVAISVSAVQAQETLGSRALQLQADRLIYDTGGSRVIAQGNVELYYNNYILTADQVIYDQGTNKLTAEGNAQLKDPNGNITRADRLEALDEFRDAFVRSMGTTATQR
jgi:LPS-assembly protein